MKYLLFVIAALLVTLNSYGQDPVQPLRSIPDQQSEKRFWDRVFLNPELGLQFGTVTLINVSPKVGYKFTDRFAAGLGATYIYIKDKTFQSYGYTYETSLYGGSVFAQYSILENVNLYTEFQNLSLEAYDLNTQKLSRMIVPSLFVGGGYLSKIGENSGIQLMLLYDVIDDPYSIYENPVIRVGFFFGL